MLYSFLATVNGVVPIEMALVVGTMLFALSWVRPRRITPSLHDGSRRRVLLGAGIAGSLVIVVVASVTSSVPVEIVGGSGFAGWWRRPAPLVAATAVVAVAGFLLGRSPLPTPGERAIVPRRPWATYAPSPLVWAGGGLAAIVGATAAWQIAIGSTAPASGPFFGYVPDYTTLPVYRSFAGDYGYVAGVGWPNHLATLAAGVVAATVYVLVLRHDANRPVSGRLTVPSVTPERTSAAWLFSLLVLAGVLTTLGALWLHVGSYGSTPVGLEETWISADRSFPTVFVDGDYSAVARPMKLAGYVLQGSGVALALRLAVDTARSAFATRRTAPRRVDAAAAAAR
jgi:hypothetical protein